MRNRRCGFLFLRILLTSSLATFVVAQKTPDMRLNSGPVPNDCRRPQIAASESSVYVVWEDDRNVLHSFPPYPHVPDIYFNRSLDGGATWLPTDVRLDVGSPPGAATSEHPQVSASGLSVYVTWQDSRSGSPDIYFNRSLDGGTTWLPNDVRLDSGNAPGAANSRNPQIAAMASSVYVTWQDDRSGNADIYFNRSLDGGATWLAADVRLDVGSAPGVAVSALPQIAASGSSVYVTWYDYRNGNNADIYFNRSLDGGVTWLAIDVRLDVGSAPGAAGSAYPQIAASGSFVYVVWMDARSTVRMFDAYFNRSLDSGTTWLPADIQLNWNGPSNWFSAATTFYPQIAASGTSVYVTWSWNFFGPWHIYFDRSLDGGTTWLPREVRLDVTSTNFAAVSVGQQIAASGSSIYVTWTNNPINGTSGIDINFTLASGYQPYGSGTAGTNAITPVLSGSGNAAISGTVSLDFFNGLGGAPGLLVVGDGPTSKVAQPLLGGTLLVSSAVTLFFVLGGTVGTPGAGSHSILTPVPNNVNLLGLNANFQGLFLDSGATLGVSMSNALETWIG